MTTDGTFNYTYDDEGNIISKTEISSGDETVYTWDHRNRLVEVDSVVGGVTTVLASYTYDALDRRIGRAEGGVATWTLYNGNSPILDFDGSGTLKSRYLDGPTPTGIDAVLARDTASGTAWYLSDRLGTVRDLVDNSSVVIDHVDYNAYGAVVGETAPAIGDRLTGFAGLDRDVATGLNLAKHRAQDPMTGRWLSEDPIGFNSRLVNLYSYLGGDPVNDIDPSGLEAIAIGAGLIGGGFGGTAAGGAAAGGSLAPLLAPVAACGIVAYGGYKAGEAINDSGYNPFTPILTGVAEWWYEKSYRDGDLPSRGKPNSSEAIDDGRGGGQIRDYGPDGRAKQDCDFGHDHGAGDPHIHDWDWSKKPARQPGRPLLPGE